MKKFSKPAASTVMFLMIGCATPQAGQVAKKYKRDLDPLLGTVAMGDINTMYGEPEYVESIGDKRFLHYRIVDEDWIRIESKGYSHSGWAHQSSEAHSSRFSPERVRLRVEVDNEDRLLAWWARSY